MSSGATHDNASRRVAAPAGIVALVLTRDPVFAVAVWIGCGVIGRVITPDLDMHDKVTKSERKIVRHVPVLGWLWVMYWEGYARIIPRHRHWLSHGPVVSTVGRWAYVVAPLLIAGLLLDLWRPAGISAKMTTSY